MLKNIVLTLIISILFVSCYHEYNDPQEVPEPLLTTGQMAEILTDVQLAEGIITINRIKKLGKALPLRDSIYKTVLNHYGITGEQLQENINYYNIQPEQMEKIYEEVLTKLSMIQSGLNIEAAKKAEEQKKLEEKNKAEEENKSDERKNVENNKEIKSDSAHRELD